MRYRIVIDIDSEHERDIINELAKMQANKISSLNGIYLVYLATEEVVDEKRCIFKDDE